MENLWKYCEEAEFNPYAAIDAIEERIGVKLECDCQIITMRSRIDGKHWLMLLVPILARLTGIMIFFNR